MPLSCNRRKVIVGRQTWCDLAVLWWDEDVNFQSTDSSVELRCEITSPGWISPLQMGKNCCIRQNTFKSHLLQQMFCLFGFLQERRLYLLVRCTSGWRNAITSLLWEAIGSTLLLNGKNCGQSHQTWWPNNASIALIVFSFSTFILEEHWIAFWFSFIVVQIVLHSLQLPDAKDVSPSKAYWESFLCRYYSLVLSLNRLVEETVKLFWLLFTFKQSMFLQNMV